MAGGFGGGYRRQQQEKRRKIITVSLIAVALAGLSYWWGGEVVRSSEVAYKQQAMKLQDERGQLEKTITDLKSQVQSSEVRYDQLSARYQAEVPQGEFKRLADLVKRQLDGGIKPDRLAFVIESARPPRNCT